AHVTAECIGGNAKTSDMAKMTGTIGIRPSHRGQDVCHGSILEGDWFAFAAQVGGAGGGVGRWRRRLAQVSGGPKVRAAGAHKLRLGRPFGGVLTEPLVIF